MSHHPNKKIKIIRQKKQWPGKFYLITGVILTTLGSFLASIIYSWLGWMTLFTLITFNLISNESLRFWFVVIGVFSGASSGFIASFTLWLGMLRLVIYPVRLFWQTWAAWTVVGTIFWVFAGGLTKYSTYILCSGTVARAVIIIVTAWMRHRRKFKVQNLR
jgi:hypothetical protein